MKAIKKYLAILFLIVTFPLFRFIANNFILDTSNEIYEFVPQESDFVIEINTRNFIKEILYQRIYAEEYFNKKIYPKVEEGATERKWRASGIDLFGKIVCFREQWANEAIWFAVIKHTDPDALKSFIRANNPEAIFEITEKYAIIQLNSSTNQEKLSEHLIKISKKEIKSFSERQNIIDLFDRDKEINCFIIPKVSEYNSLLDGYFSFDFLKDHIKIEGAFTPISGLKDFKPIAYAIDKEQALSLRSSLNIFNSIYLFNDQKVENVPEYTQLALDYNGADCQMIHRNQGYSTPFKTYPLVKIHFDLLDQKMWNAFFDSVKVTPGIRVDTVNRIIETAQGASFRYRQTANIFELMQDSIQLIDAAPSNVYFDLYLNSDCVIDRTKFSAHKEFPPSDFEQTMGMMVAGKMLEEIRSLANMEWIEFRIEGSDDETINVTGRVEMKEKNGHSMVESLSFGTMLFNFISAY